jgi:hypothetical protein
MNTHYHNTRHWVLFILTVGIPFVAYFGWLFSFLSSFSYNYEPDIDAMVRGISIYIILALVSSLIYYGWLWSAGVGLQKYLPENLRMNTAFFKVSILYPVIFGVLYLSFVTWLLSKGVENLEHIDLDPGILPFFLLTIPLGLFAAFCAFYAFWFAGKTVKTMELQREVKFSDFVAEFFLFWFYFVGVWIIQPKINKKVRESR